MIARPILPKITKKMFPMNENDNNNEYSSNQLCGEFPTRNPTAHLEETIRFGTFDTLELLVIQQSVYEKQKYRKRSDYFYPKDMGFEWVWFEIYIWVEVFG